MPLYEYLCPSCNTQFEARQPFEDRENSPCPKCHKLARKKISVVNHTWTWCLDSLKDDIPRKWHDPYH